MDRMSVASVREVVARCRHDYEQAGRWEKASILSDLQELTGYHRKSLVRLLGQDERQNDERPDRRRGSRYAVVLPQLHRLWEATFYSCGKRLQPFIPELLPVMLEAGELEATPFQQELLLSISAASVDRLLAPYRRRLPGRGRAMTKPGTLLREQIPIRTFADWDEKRPGFFEIDLVAHCGESTEGEYLHTLNIVDVCTGWLTMGAMKGKGQVGTVAAIDGAWKHVPFEVLGIDSDNGSEFIIMYPENWTGG